MEKSQVNEKYVLALVENSDATLSVRRIDRPSSELPITELEAMVDNPNRTIYDMSSYFYSVFSPKVKSFAFCYPSEYNDSYIDSRSVPKEISYADYVQGDKEIETTFNSKHRSCKEPLDALKSKLDKEIIEANHSAKKKYLNKASIYIKCLRLSETVKNTKEHNEIKLYSRDVVGYSTYTHKINDDITVELRTNFGYGSAAYFNLAVKYKDIVILPYSYLVHYYYANMKSLMACTRAYRPLRESWDASIAFIADFVNQSIADPRKFVGEYVIKEVEEMMKGLRAIMDNPAEVQSRIKDLTSSEIRLSVIRPFNKDEFIMMETMADELTILFKAEKITGSLLFVESLKQLQEVCGDMSALIDEILSMNKGVKPEIPPVLNSVRSTIETFKREEMNLERQIKFKENRKLYFNKRKERLQAKMTFAEKIAHDKIFREKNPLYVKLEEEINELNQKVYNLQDKIQKRERVEERLTVCLKRTGSIEEYKKEEHVSE
jgi:hypothetical protein